MNNKYLLKNFFDKTASSTIYRYKNKIIKKIPKKINKTDYNYKNEFNILKKINNSKNNDDKINNKIIKINETYEDINYFYSVMDYYQRGDLYYNVYNKRISIKNYKKIIQKLMEPIHKIHNLNIVHLDLKLENYVLDNISDNFILIDFNLSQFHNNNYYKLEKIKTLTGTKPYIAPEIFDGYYCKSSDMYSLGCMLYLIYTSRNYNGNFDLLQNQPYELENTIKELLCDNYKIRPSIYDIKYFLT